MCQDYKKAQNNIAAMTHEAYEGSVGARALARAGQCPNLKGHVHEVMFCDKVNANPVNIAKGHHAELTKSNVAKMKDIIVRNRQGKIVSHAQLKDTVSSSGVAKTARQIKAGHYNKTRVYGTEETTAKLAGKTTQKVHSSGISSETTQRVADKALGKMPSLSSIGSAAKSGGAAGAAIGAGIEAISSISDVIDGKKDAADAVVDIAGAGIKGGVTGAASAAAGSVAAGAAGAVTTAVTSTAIGGAAAATAVGSVAVAVAPLVVSFGVACAVGSFISSLFDD
ncbi:MAG: hypothetical protein ACI4OH_11445 [Mitsuokella sp.]|uniref:hypothetical protein n=1 Tax=Mitsuokella sp. TaxID=2049034 RepID=UPI003F0A6788